MSKLPQTIRDAVKVARGVGVQYLWVDAFSIIQDDEDDKMDQISHMRDIYRGSYVTISATTAASSDESFLEPRGTWRLARMRVRWEDNVYSDVLITPRYNGEIDHRIFTRGWTFQELHLPSRILSFRRRGLMYACLQGRSYDGGLPYFMDKAALDPGLRSVGEQRHPLRWMVIVRMYSARKLSVDADKLLAIAAFAEEHARTMSGTSYLARLWREDLPLQLAWKPMYVIETLRPLEYRAPSWCWPCLDGEVMFEAERRGYSSYSQDVITCEVLDACTEAYDKRNPCGMHVYLDVFSEWSPGSRPSLMCLELYTYFETASQQEHDMKNSFAIILYPVGDKLYRRVGTLHTHRNVDQGYWFDEDYIIGEVTIV